MLHELLLSCLGFTGDIIVEAHGTFKVSLSFELLSQAEREQTDKIAALGWFYSALLKYTETNSLRIDGPRFQLYKLSLCAGVADFREEYAKDISELELRVISEGPLPLSFLVPYLQKVRIY